MRLFFPFLVFVGTAIPINVAKLQCGQTPIRPNVTPKPKISEKFETRIAGGLLPVPHSWPWQVLLIRSNGTVGNLCGGTIIANQWILTAAHCFYEQKLTELKAYVGVQNRKKRGKPLLVQQMYAHPLFDPPKQGIVHDVMLLKLTRPIEYSDQVQPICLPAADDDIIIPPNTAWATGWGYVKLDGAVNDELLEVNVPFIDLDECVINYKTKGTRIGTLQFCAGGKGKDTCQGDSGGPLVVQSSDGSWFQHGITSWGGECGSGIGSVYTRVSGYCDWIKATTNGEAACHEP